MKIRDVLIGFVVSAVVVGIAVSCGGGSGTSGPTGPATYTVSGALSGATGTVVLKLNGGSDVSMANGPFTFTTMLASGATFNVQVVDASDRCTVTGGAGTMTAANVTGVAVACAAQGIQEVIRSARLDGAQASTTATGTGLGGVIVNPTTRAITGGITFSGLTGNPTAAHIHRGDTTIAVGLTLASDNATGIVLDNIALSPADYAELLAGTLYFNVHTAANPNGEIRGQINVQGGVLAALENLDGNQEVNSTGTTVSTSTATGKGTVIVDAATGAIPIAYIMHTVGANTTMSHIHRSPSGPTSTGPIIVFFSLQPNIGGTGTDVTYPSTNANATLGNPAISGDIAANLANFTANYLYFNVHSSNNICGTNGISSCGSGEIRGNITSQ